MTDQTKRIADELHVANKYLKKIADCLTPLQWQMNDDEAEELMDELRKRGSLHVDESEVVLEPFAFRQNEKISEKEKGDVNWV